MDKKVTVLAREWVSAGEAMKTLGKSERSLQRLVTAGELRWTFETGTRTRLYHAGDLARIKEDGIQTSRERASTALAVRPKSQPALESVARVGVTEKLWLSLDEAAEYSGLSPSYLRDSVVAPQAHQEGQNLIGIKGGPHGAWRIQRASLEAFAG